MCMGAPMPEIALVESNLYIAYIVSSAHNPEEPYAIVRFGGVLQHTFGYPNDEALGAHPLYDYGLQYYSFNEILTSPYLKQLGARNNSVFPGSAGHFTSFRHWLVAFHDETLEVVGSTVELVHVGQYESARHAIASFLATETGA